MAAVLTAAQSLTITQEFHDLSVAAGRFRFANWNNLTEDQRQQLENQQWTLLNYSSDFASLSMLDTVDDLSLTLKSLKDLTDQASAALTRLKTVDKVLRIVTIAAALGAAIASENPSAIAQQLQALFDIFTAKAGGAAS